MIDSRPRTVGAVRKNVRMAFAPKYSHEQRAAIVAAVLDDNHTVPAAVKAAERGELGPAFTMPLGTAYSLVAAERERRRPPVTIAELAQRILDRCVRELERIDALPELGRADVHALHGMSRIARIAGPLVPAASPPPGDDAPKPQGLAARIAAHAQSDELAAKVRASRAHAAATP